ncbi:aminotransferase class V-fold PLP-dependent enzyme [Spirochaeta isovalerica]|uniref:Probable cysteine desulfurase n=1 Tax=Spirochaeta isovalerica TaxID=150 RepID=A0A841R9M9_9SPIO|nr:cysteine desulfurase [Spirochaeta isovalerica]MBB6480071.1 cysteine desulfurase/selenocysteine lyase [Spirochaeta isovalerica]
MNREDFPLLWEGVYLDSGATSQKPLQVIERIDRYYRNENANVHRGVYELSAKATVLYEEARERVARFIGAVRDEIIFTRGTTESINMTAFSFAEPLMQPGDEILISHMEHHANIVPWQLLCERTGAVLKVIPIDRNGNLDRPALSALLTGRTRLLALTHISNVLGTVNPVKEIIAEAHEKGIPVLIDGAQAVGRTKVDVNDLDADFYAFSGHKMYGPTGIGILYGKKKHLEKMRPYQSGGDMILRVTFEKTTWNEIPHKFEAGTPNIAGTIGLAEAVRYLERIGMDEVEAAEDEVMSYALEKLGRIEGLEIIGSPDRRSGAITFTLGDAHPHDIAHELARKNIAVRAGHHCAQPLMNFYKVPAATRMSLGLYNGKEDIDKLADALPEIREKFKL